MFPHAVHEKQDFRATSLETLRQMVASGSGITLLPRLAANGAYGNARGMVTVCPSPNPNPCATSARCGAGLPRAAKPSRRVCEVIAEFAGKQVAA